jgi:hypothetical protein
MRSSAIASTRIFQANSLRVSARCVAPRDAAAVERRPITKMYWSRFECGLSAEATDLLRRRLAARGSVAPYSGAWPYRPDDVSLDNQARNAAAWISRITDALRGHRVFVTYNMMYSDAHHQARAH